MPRPSFPRSVLTAALLVAAVPAAAENWADDKEWKDMASSKAICAQFRDASPPATDQPDATTRESLRDCDAEGLYWGIGMPADPVRARQCAFVQDDTPFNGASLLMVIYANGVGAARNWPVAINLACTIGGAPAEIDGRVAHLDQLRRQNWQGRDFSWCDDVTSGYAAGWCANHESRLAQPRKAAELASLSKQWNSPPVASAFGKLTNAVAAFVSARGENEVDQTGTARAAMMIEEEESLRQQFLDDLKAFAEGKPPCAGAERNADADTQLNDIYRRIQKQAAADFRDSNGTVEQSGIKATQRVWLKYRDAWVAFAAAAYPQLPKAAVINWLTARRVEQLQAFVN